MSLYSSIIYFFRILIFEWQVFFLYLLAIILIWVEWKSSSKFNQVFLLSLALNLELWLRSEVLFEKCRVKNANLVKLRVKNHNCRENSVAKNYDQEFLIMAIMSHQPLFLQLCTYVRFSLTIFWTTKNILIRVFKKKKKRERKGMSMHIYWQLYLYKIKCWKLRKLKASIRIS